MLPPSWQYLTMDLMYPKLDLKKQSAECLAFLITIQQSKVQSISNIFLKLSLRNLKNGVKTPKTGNNDKYQKQKRNNSSTGIKNLQFFIGFQ
jgi:hypothetical protein